MGLVAGDVRARSRTPRVDVTDGAGIAASTWPALLYKTRFQWRRWWLSHWLPCTTLGREVDDRDRFAAACR